MSEMTKRFFSPALFVFLLAAAGASFAAGTKEQRLAPSGFGITPGVTGGVGPQAFGIELEGLVPELVIGPTWLLDLSDAQQKAIDRIYADQRKEQWAFMYQMLAENAKLKKLMKADLWDVEKIDQVYDEVFTLRRNRIDSVARLHNELVNLLTKKQRQDLEDLRQAEPLPNN
jgi:Spy/CpxP family protein refolding chaperone